MSFRVNFWSFSKRPNSTKQPDTTNPHTGFDCTLKGPCSIMAPVLEVNYGNSGNDPIGYNYCYIPNFDRFYWVSDWVNDGPIWECRLSEDELGTWKTAIGGSSQYILRSSHTSDGSIVDTCYPATGAVNTITNTAGSPWDQLMPTSGVGCYVIGIINNDQGYTAARIGATCYYVVTPAAMVNILIWLMNPGNFFPSISGQDDSTQAFYKSLYDPIQYMVSCMFCPITPAVGSSTTTIGYGPYAHTLTNGSAWYLNTGGVPAATGSVAIPKHPQAATRGTYLNGSPYSKYQIEIRPFGWIPLDPSDLWGYSTLYYWIYFDAVSGNATLLLSTNSNRTNIVYEQSALVGVPTNLAQTSRDYLGAGMSVLGAIGGVASGIGMGNVPGAIMSGVSGIGNAAANMLPQTQTQGSNGSFAELILGRVALVGRFTLIVSEDNADRGRPLCVKGTISSYPGYLVVADPDVSILEANQTELEAIRNYMSNGFFYE